jgi:hypothetical protein
MLPKKFVRKKLKSLKQIINFKSKESLQLNISFGKKLICKRVVFSFVFSPSLARGEEENNTPNAHSLRYQKNFKSSSYASSDNNFQH